jgi:hypothetical protein
MKAFKIKKRSHRKPVFIIGPSVTSFVKPKLPRFFFSDVHPPALFKPQSNFEIIEVDLAVVEPVAVAEPAAELDLEQPELAAMLDFVAGNLPAGFQRLARIVEMPAEFSGL